MISEVVKCPKEGNTLQMQLWQDGKFPRPRQQILDQVGYGDPGFCLSLNSGGRDQRRETFHFKKDVLEKPYSSGEEKKAAYSLVRAIQNGKHGESLMSHVKKAGGLLALDSLRVETKVLAQIVEDEPMSKRPH